MRLFSFIFLFISSVLCSATNRTLIVGIGNYDTFHFSGHGQPVADLNGDFEEKIIDGKSGIKFSDTLIYQSIKSLDQ